MSCRIAAEICTLPVLSAHLKKGKGSPYSITERRVPKLIPVLGSQCDWCEMTAVACGKHGTAVVDTSDCRCTVRSQAGFLTGTCRLPDSPSVCPSVCLSLSWPLQSSKQCSQQSNWTERNCSSRSVLFFSRPRSESWPHHGRTFSIYFCPLPL